MIFVEATFPMKDRISPEVTALLLRGNVTSVEWKALVINAYEREALYPALTNEALIEEAKIIAAGTARIRNPATTYEEAAYGVILPLIIERLKMAEIRLHDPMGLLPESKKPGMNYVSQGSTFVMGFHAGWVACESPKEAHPNDPTDDYTRCLQEILKLAGFLTKNDLPVCRWCMKHMPAGELPDHPCEFKEKEEGNRRPAVPEDFNFGAWPDEGVRIAECRWCLKTMPAEQTRHHACEEKKT